MVMINIKNAPFPEDVKLQIIKLGFKEWDWGHPRVVLNNPLSYFQQKLLEFKVVEEAPKVRLSKSSKFKAGNDIPAEAMFTSS